MISPEAVQAALDAMRVKRANQDVEAYFKGRPRQTRDAEYRVAMQAALAAAFPIMLREVADQVLTDAEGIDGVLDAISVSLALLKLADTYGKEKL